MDKKLYDFYCNKRVLITGHTGFKGSWLSTMLLSAGANLCGYSHKEYPLFAATGLSSRMQSEIGDIRDYLHLNSVIQDFLPDIVFHLAAQPLVIDSYHDPHYTYETNVMGTVNILESIRHCKSVTAAVNITTDKVYQNNEWPWGYRENDTLNGYDPYSNSKSCSEIITAGYNKSFFSDINSVLIATARAGNVIGGGDFSVNRIIPDCVRAAEKSSTIIVRNCISVRPWQHVIEPLCGYMTLAQMLFERKTQEKSFNFGPNDQDCVDVGTLVDFFCSAWGKGASWKYCPDSDALHEANFLKLDCSKAHNILGWQPKMNIQRAIKLSVDWYQAFQNGEDAFLIMKRQIEEYFSC